MPILEGDPKYSKRGQKGTRFWGKRGPKRGPKNEEDEEEEDIEEDEEDEKDKEVEEDEEDEEDEEYKRLFCDEIQSSWNSQRSDSLWCFACGGVYILGPIYSWYGLADKLPLDNCQ